MAALSFAYSRVASSDLDDSSSSNGKASDKGSKRQDVRSLVITGATWGLLVISNLTLLGLWWRSSQLAKVCVRPKLSYSPAKEAIKYELRRLHRALDHNNFTGEPRQEFDAAWNQILEPDLLDPKHETAMTIKISQEELSHLSDESIAFQDGSGYIAELAVYHEIHCVKILRRFLNMDYYYPNITKEKLDFEKVHADHCLEYLREAAMCRGDTTLTTFFWKNEIPYSRVYSDHECVNWEALDTWARSRMVDMSSYDHLEH
ncbi:hypothetical protein N7468_000928 [Penicillium chermesinum]|uniref:Uncharacterized protein n=1 Tax=Penicillium chermesinum TaxID=63820 RepID=A0A9W9PFU7_9EURO|nr:uncharacterized protein N7468_000928 [Penicillium chermesinum]KAJ5245945.1 hypothetical protein N7468_000928 [Penicillium chermesinum]KAJ6144241.1 hypothetical protein N7470_008136 [Penicillium chermesinum]